MNVVGRCSNEQKLVTPNALFQTWDSIIEEAMASASPVASGALLN